MELVPCDCAEDDRAAASWARARADANLGPALDRRTFAAFDATRQPAAHEAARLFAAELNHSLVLIGPPGTGKSHLAAAVVNQALADHHRPVYWSVPALLDHLRVGYDRDLSPMARYDARLARLLDCEVLVLDDLGAEQSTDWTMATLFAIIDYRWIRELPTVTTTNLALDQLHPRLASRLGDRARSRVVTLRPGDYRRAPARAAERQAGRA